MQAGIRKAGKLSDFMVEIWKNRREKNQKRMKLMCPLTVQNMSTHSLWENQPRQDSLINTFEYANGSWHKKLWRAAIAWFQWVQIQRAQRILEEEEEEEDRGWEVPDSCWGDVCMLPAFIHLCVPVCAESQRNLRLTKTFSFGCRPETNEWLKIKICKLENPILKFKQIVQLSHFIQNKTSIHYICRLHAKVLNKDLVRAISICSVRITLSY